MDELTWIRQALLVVHAGAFAFAFSTVLREDWALVRTRQIDIASLARAARTLTRALIALWATGLALMALQLGFDAGAVLESPKLAAKLLVVSALTFNGMALHALVFPRLLVRPGDGPVVLPTRAVVLGAVSTASWLVASFIGLSRMVAPSMRLSDYLAVYAAVLAIAVGTALIAMRPAGAFTWRSQP
ncbi:MAG: hypothetical protein H7Y61_18490 [Rhizobiales bacterium]|nr:hypothetical protein [Rhizobacter sp.]